MVSLRPFNYLQYEYIFNTEIDDYNLPKRITTSMLKFPKDSQFARVVVDEASKVINNRKMVPWGIIGPAFLDKVVKDMKLEHFSLDYMDTCQIPYAYARDFINKNEIDNNRPALHLFSEMWNFYELNKNHFYTDGIYGKLLKKHNIFELSKQLGYEPSFKDKYYNEILFFKKIYRMVKKIFLYVPTKSYRVLKKLFKIFK